MKVTSKETGDMDDNDDLFIFTLYVAGITDEVEKMVINLKALLKTECHATCEVHVVDVITMPEQAVKDNVFVTPTLVKSLPEPIVKLIGDLKDTGRIMMALSIDGDDKQNMLI